MKTSDMKLRIEKELPCEVYIIARRDDGDRFWRLTWNYNHTIEVHPDSLPELADLFNQMAANTPKKKDT